MPEKQTNKERLKEITDSIEANIQDLFQSDKYKDYLRTMSRFHKYSFNNTMLIHMQKPNATLVTGYSKWEQKFNRHVKRGEKGIKIIAPMPFKKKIEQEKLDPDTKLPMRDNDGNVIMEEKTVKIPMFRPTVVFDVSQTVGAPLPVLVSDLKGDVRHFDIFMEALRRSSPVPIEMKALASNMDGYFNMNEQKICLREDMSEVQTVCAAVHEKLLMPSCTMSRSTIRTMRICPQRKQGKNAKLKRLRRYAHHPKMYSINEMADNYRTFGRKR